uniref:Uncharacterized protein n=1 Tax=Cyprinus carpio carpio TaxID=630221 RepID=A0A9J7YGQ7_CYPCA
MFHTSVHYLQNTRLALDNLESVPEKLRLLENFKDLEQRYAKYKEIVGDLQHQLEESKRRIQEYSNIFPISFTRNKLLDIRNSTPNNFLQTFEHSDVLLDILVGGAHSSGESPLSSK